MEKRRPDSSRSAAGAASVTSTPTDDTYVDSGSVSAVHGAANNLRVRDASRDLHTYLKFTVAAVGTPDSSILRLWVLDGSVAGDPCTSFPTRPGVRRA